MHISTALLEKNASKKSAAERIRLISMFSL